MAPPSPTRPSDAELRRLYTDEQMTTRQLGERFKVRHITIRRWLKAAGIERRHAGIGLEYRGVTPPTAVELVQMIHVEHLGYRGVAERYGVDPTAVPYWLEKHGIPKPKIWATRRKGHAPDLPSPKEAAARYLAGESMYSIGKSCGVSEIPIKRILTEAGVEFRKDGWKGGKRYPCKDGHEARSLYEQRVDDWLHDHGLEHEVEPAYPWDRRYRADFRVGDTYIEVWGVTDNEKYQDRKRMKIERCKAESIPLIQINHWQFAKGRRWWRPLQQLTAATGQSPLPWPPGTPA